LGPPDPSEDWYASVPEYARLNLPETKPVKFEEYFAHRMKDEQGRQAVELLGHLLRYDPS